MIRKKQFGELEFAIMEVLRGCAEATVREVHERLGKENSYTTIMTVMSRMAEKGLLDRYKDGRRFVYSIAKGSEEQSWSVLKRIKNTVFSGKRVKMIAALFDSDEEINEEELKELEQMILKARSKKKE